MIANISSDLINYDESVTTSRFA